MGVGGEDWPVLMNKACLIYTHFIPFITVILREPACSSACKKIKNKKPSMQQAVIPIDNVRKNFESGYANTILDK